MTSEERREARYRRRKAARAVKRAAANARHDSFNKVFSYLNMYRSYRKCRRGVAWKSSVQKYISRAPLEVYRSYERLHSGRYKSPGFYEFDLVERGKKRHIRSTVIGERVVQRCLCDNALVPVLARTLIHDNGATMPKKGYDFAMRRYEQHLHEYYRKHGADGWVLMLDFSAFFDSVSHEVLSGILRKNFTDERIIGLTEHLIGMFGDVGLGLGSQISQVLALVSVNRLDHFVKEQLRVRGYGRYMDDAYLIHHDKAFLERCLAQIRKVCAELGIRLSEKKTHIMRLTHTTWLKTRFYLTESGKVIKKIYRRSVTVQRRKLKKMRRMLDAGIITIEDVARNMASWDGYASRFDAWNTRQSMWALYVKLYRKDLVEHGLYQGDRLQDRRSRWRGSSGKSDVGSIRQSSPT